ncbi:hypothetical protein BGZ51_004050 [Haplosporangium sp. Z 767]|nr:hypothetical protein BGZ51_004050 [Haplosporangium sp. Z 767]
MLKIDDAALFKISDEKNYKIVSTTAVGNFKDYVLVQSGTPFPPAPMFTNGTVFATITAKNAVSLAATTVAFIEILGRRFALKLVATEGFVSSPCIQLGLDRKENVDIEDKNMTLRTEQFNGAGVVFSTFGSELGTEHKSLITSQRAGWLEFYSTFSLVAPAQILTVTINNNYNCFKVAVNAKHNDLLTPPHPASTTTPLRGFFLELHTNRFSLLMLLNVDMLIDETNTGAGMSASFQNYQLTADADYKFLKNKAVFREDGIVNLNDGRDWFAFAVVMDDTILQDFVRQGFVRAVHPDVPYSWICNIAKDEPKKMSTSADCAAPDVTKPLPLTVPLSTSP